MVFPGVKLTCPADVKVTVEAGIGRLPVYWRLPNITGIDTDGQTMIDDTSMTESVSSTSYMDLLQLDQTTLLGSKGVKMISTHNPGDFFNIGIAQVVYSVVETNNNITVTNCSFDVYVEGLLF